jgi:hypothetical protein
MQNAKTCPICRSLTYFVTPSPVWPKDAEEKDLIIQDYKDKLRFFSFDIAKSIAVILTLAKGAVRFLPHVSIGMQIG